MAWRVKRSYFDGPDVEGGIMCWRAADLGTIFPTDDRDRIVFELAR
jgi:hypothetical protein